jgi:DNA invertase Pin-like site-specific DNA recombinase
MTRRRQLPRSFEELAGLRCRGLVRESTVEQGANSGPIVQLRDQVEFAARWGLDFQTRPGPAGPEPHTYTDLVSGSDAAKRPQFLQAIADAKVGAYDVLLVRDTSRFARNWRQAGGYEDQLHDAGVVVAYLMEGKLSSDHTAQLQIVVNHSINEDYRVKLARNVQQGFRVKRFEAGRFSGSPPIGYVMEYEDVPVAGAKGWERRDTGRLLPDRTPRPRIGFDETYTNADLVVRIGELYATGLYGARALAAVLNLEGYRAASGVPFTGNALRHLLSSPTYAGQLSWHHRKDKRDRGETGELVRGSWEPLWPAPLWERIQAVRGQHFRGSAGGRARFVYPFRRVAFCDRCDRPLIGEAHRDVPYMVCSTQRERHECDQRAVRSAILEDQVGRWLATLEVPDDWKAELARLDAGTRRRRQAEPSVDRATIETQLRRLNDLYLDLAITREEWVGRKRALEEQIHGGPEQPRYFEADLVRFQGVIESWGRLWQRATAAERAELVGAIFGRVRVRDKAIVHAELADPAAAPLIAMSEAHRIRLAMPAGTPDTEVGLAPPDGLEHARPTAPWELVLVQRPPVIAVAGIRPMVGQLLAG